MFGRNSRSFPSDNRLAATSATSQAWDKLISIDKAIGTFRTTASASASIAAAVASTVGKTLAKAVHPGSAGTPTSPDSTPTASRSPQVETHDREPTRSKHEWADLAAMIIGPTSTDLRAGQPWHRRVLRTDKVVGFPLGWLRITPNDLLWSPHQSSGAKQHAKQGLAEVVQLDEASIADVELVAIGRRRAGLTVTTRAGDELWLLLNNRQKVDEMLRRLRYGDRS